jgi:hypothetical protein
MFVDLPGCWPPKDLPPEPPKRRLSVREEKVLLWLLGLNAFGLLIAPIGGVSLIQFLFAWK